MKKVKIVFLDMRSGRKQTPSQCKAVTVLPDAFTIMTSSPSRQIINVLMPWLESDSKQVVWDAKRDTCVFVLLRPGLR